MTEQTFYRCKKKHGGTSTDRPKEMKRLQRENERLRKAISDLTLDKLVLAEAQRMKAVKETIQWMVYRPEREALLSPSRRRTCIDRVRVELNISERRACRFRTQHRSTQR